MAIPAALRRTLLVVVAKGSGLDGLAVDPPQLQGGFRPAADEQGGNSILV